MSRFSRRRRNDGSNDRTSPGKASGAARKGAWGIARIINLIAGLVAAVLVAAILLVVLEANRDNSIVEALLDAGRFLAGPFKDIFDLSDRKLEVGVNYGIAALVYLAVAALIGRLLRR